MARNENPTGLLTNAHVDPKWDGAWLMLHAGIGLGFAKHYMDRLKPNFTDEDIKHVVRRTVDLCRANSRPGYYGAAIESLGLVTRFMQNAAFCRRVHNALTQYAPDSVGFYWRGVGRSVYFHPINFMPGFLRPCRAIHMCEVEAPNLEMKETMLSGQRHGERDRVPGEHKARAPRSAKVYVITCSDSRTEATDEGGRIIREALARAGHSVAGSAIIPDDPLIPQFMNYKPNPKNRTLCGLWNSKIKGSLETALQTIYPVLKKHHHLDQVFKYQSLPALAARLERGDVAGASV